MRRLWTVGAFAMLCLLVVFLCVTSQRDRQWHAESAADRHRLHDQVDALRARLDRIDGRAP